MESIKEILIRRDGMSSKDADFLIEDAKEELQFYINDDDMDSAENVCQEFFGLEPDYLDELMPY